jgi:ATP-dependent protease ClpP protease subunit
MGGVHARCRDLHRGTLHSAQPVGPGNGIHHGNYARWHRIVFATGEIVPSDAARLVVFLASADRDPWGNKQLALSSGGGSVTAAFDMVAVMDRERVSTFVPANISCASACAQVLFVSGIHRLVLDGGRLGIHTCSRAGKASELCNERIASNAVAHGVAHGAVMASMQFVSPDGMAWFSAADADCWGLTRWPPGYHRGVAPGEVAPCAMEMFRRFKGR